MSVQIATINANQGSVHWIQILDPYGRPYDGTEIDEIRWTLTDGDGNTINGRDEVSVLDENGGAFDGFYGVSEVSQTRQDGLVIRTATAHRLRDGSIVMPRGVGLGIYPPNLSPTPIRTLGQSALAPLGQCPRDWADVAPGAELVAGVFTLTLTADDNAPTGSPAVGERQQRVSTLEFLLDGERVTLEVLRYHVRVT